MFLLGDAVQIGGVDQAPGLLADGGDDARMGVAETGDGDAGQGVEVLATLGVPDPHALTAGERHGQPAVRVHQMHGPQLPPEKHTAAWVPPWVVDDSRT